MKPNFHHQEIALAELNKGKLGLFLEQGLGKTKVVLNYIHQNKIRKVLILCPKAAINVWHDEAKEEAPGYMVLMISGAKDKRDLLCRLNANIYITNYETYIRITDMAFLDGFELYVLDESHRVKNPKTQVFKALKTRPQKKILMTGTPITNTLLDVWAQAYLMDRSLWPNFFLFRKRYFKNVNLMTNLPYPDWREIPGSREEVINKIKPYSIIMKKDDCLNLPDKTFQVIQVDFDPEQKRLYDEMKRHLLTELDDSVIIASTALVKIVRLQQICNGFVSAPDYVLQENVIRHTKVNPKLDILIDMVQDMVQDRNGQLVIWAWFKNDRAMITQALKEAKITYSEIGGETSSEDRATAVKRFQAGDVKVFVGQQKAAGISITLTKASTAIFFSNSYHLGDRLQAIDRIHRIGQSKNVLIIDLVMKDSIEVRIAEILNKKNDLLEYLKRQGIRTLLG